MMMFRKHRSKPSDFTRQRKLGFKEILVSVLINMKHTLSLEIDNFLKKLNVDEALVYTKQAYSKARQKLLPSAFIELNDIVLEEVYSNSFKTFKGFRLIAVDGSSIELPNKLILCVTLLLVFIKVIPLVLATTLISSIISKVEVFFIFSNLFKASLNSVKLIVIFILHNSLLLIFYHTVRDNGFFMS
jgi:hypothetical protein